MVTGQEHEVVLSCDLHGVKERRMLLDDYLPEFDVRTSYATRIAASPAKVYASLWTANFDHWGITRALYSVRTLPSFPARPRETWRRFRDDDILNDLGLSVPFARHRRRSGAFCNDVLKAYGHCCAVCGYDVRVGRAVLGLEAAHIKWFQAGGPDAVDNGVALCSIHHKALGRTELVFSGHTNPGNAQAGVCATQSLPVAVNDSINM
jgi:HNH endonuclease